MVAKLPPTSPPSWTCPVPVTAPDAYELMICPPGLLSPTSPPAIMAAFGKLVLPVPLTGPVANDAEITPVLKPAKPPMAELMSVGELPLLPVTALDEDEVAT